MMLVSYNLTKYTEVEVCDFLNSISKLLDDMYGVHTSSLTFNEVFSPMCIPDVQEVIDMGYVLPTTSSYPISYAVWSKAEWYSFYRVIHHNDTGEVGVLFKDDIDAVKFKLML